jgi:hypothetical protein
MGFLFEERASDSPFIETVTRGRSAGEGSTIRPAETHWHLVITRPYGSPLPILVGPLPASGVVSFGDGVEILWIKFKLGVFMPHMPMRDFLDAETVLPGAARQSFWLRSSTWQIPDYENVEEFIARLARQDVLAQEPLVDAVLAGHPPDMSPRTLRHRFLRATGLTHTHIQQFERAQRATALLAQGVSILDTVFEAGYFDQPHLTHSLKRFIGLTPAQLFTPRSPDCRSIQDSLPVPGYYYTNEVEVI